MAYYSEHGNYAGGENCFDLLQWSPETRTRYSYYCGKDKIACTGCKTQCPDPELIDFKEGAFTIIAIGNIDKDIGCDVWTINDAKSIQNTISDLD